VSLESLNRYKTFFFSGKGGVGKSTVSALTALYLSERGKRTLTVSLDPAHSLSTLFQEELGGEPKEVAPNLFALEVDLEREMKSYLKRVKETAKKAVSPAILQQVEAQIELAYYSPGATELALTDAVYRIVKELREDFDAVVFDTAPSGHTVRLMTLPQALNRWIEGVKGLREEVLRLERFAGKKVEKDPVIEALNRRKEQYETLRRVFQSEETLFCVVVNYGKLPLKIGERTVKELEEGGVPVRLIAANKVSEEEAKETAKLFKRPVLAVPPAKEEPIGVAALSELLKEASLLPYI